MPDKRIVVIGAGPAGLTAAWEAAKQGLEALVVEKRDKVGGIACTESYRGFHFDMGGHRFFTKAQAVSDMWTEVLADDFLVRPRLSRIYYRGKFFPYPLKPVETMLNLGLWQGVLIVASYFRWQMFPLKPEETFEHWVTNRFGRRLFQAFFKSYTEKVWGIPCSELRAEWAAQRIKDLSLKKALVSMFLDGHKEVRTLIDQFHYPMRGPGMFWTAVKEAIEAAHGKVWLNRDVVQVNRSGRRIEGLGLSGDGQADSLDGENFISSMPISALIKRMEPAPPEEVLEAARSLKYRDFITVCLIVNRSDLFPDQWIYVHDPAVRMGRIQNFKNWSPSMVPDPAKTGLGLEYFCNQGDELWTSSDSDLIELGKQELSRIGLAGYDEVEDGVVYRVPKAYPVYDADYNRHLRAIRDFLAQLENLQTIGRNGLFRYNNMDHSMLTGMLAVSNLVQGEHRDPWSINEEEEYHEEVAPAEAEEKVEVDKALEEQLAPVFEKVDKVALGLSLGTVSGLALFLMTVFLLLKGGPVIGPTLSLLSQYFPGFRVSVGGSFLGLIYGFLLGFVTGWCAAVLRNSILMANLIIIHRRVQLEQLKRLWDYF